MGIDDIPMPNEQANSLNEKVNEDLVGFDKVQESVGEKAREDSGRIQAQNQLIKDLQEEEKKHKKREFDLARLIKDLLQTGTDDVLIDISLQLLERNVYAGFVLAILNLIYSDWRDEIKEKGMLEDENLDQKRFDEFLQKIHFSIIETEIKEWILHLWAIYNLVPKRLKEDLSNENNNNAGEIAKKLMTEVLNRFYKSKKMFVEELKVRMMIDDIYKKLSEIQ